MEIEGEVKGKYPITIMFKIDAPETVEDSILNSIILGLCDYRHLKNVEYKDENTIKFSNKILMRVQRQIDDLIIDEYEV